MNAQQSKLFKNQSGDTLVEVLLATVIFSIVISASYALANRATRINQLSSERSEAVNIMQSQAEALRFYRDASYEQPDGNIWDQIVDGITPGAVPTKNNCRAFFDGTGVTTTPSPIDAFFFDDNLVKQNFAPSFSAGNVGRYYIWVEIYEPTDPVDTGFYDFYFNSCWQGPGGTGPQEASFVYRLAS